MKLTNLPKEGERILIGALIIFAILLLFGGCGTLTTLSSCENMIEPDKSSCIESVKAKQDAFANRERMFDNRR